MKTLVTLLFAVFALVPLRAQQSYTLSSGSELKVSGTSTFHDWTMKSTSGTGKAVINVENNQLKGVSSVQVTLKAETLKSGKSGMDDKAYEALKTEDFQNILFTLKEFKNVNQGTYSAVGDLTIAGVKKTVTFTGKATLTDEKIQFDGKTAFKLSDFNVEPPTAMFGTIKTGNDVTVSFNATFTQVNKTL